MADVKGEVLKSVHDNLNVPGLVKDVLDKVVEPALDKLVKSTDNKFDDIAKAALYPILVDELNKQVQSLWDKIDDPPQEEVAPAPKEGDPI